VHRQKLIKNRGEFVGIRFRMPINLNWCRSDWRDTAAGRFQSLADRQQARNLDGEIQLRTWPCTGDRVFWQVASGASQVEFKPRPYESAPRFSPHSTVSGGASRPLQITTFKWSQRPRQLWTLPDSPL